MKRRRRLTDREGERLAAQTAETPPRNRVPKRSQTRERRIHDEIIIDASGGHEQAMGWYYYLENHLHFPFAARCERERAISPLTNGEEVTVLRLAPEEECEREIFVVVLWHSRVIAVPLTQLGARRTDRGTRQAVEDWHYWVGQDAELCW